MKHQIILSFFKHVPAASRDQLATLFFKSNKNPEKKCTEKMRQMVDRGLVEVNTEKKPYIYFAKPIRIKKQSNHLNHHLGLVDLVIELINCKVSFKLLAYEGNFGPGLAKPDLILEINKKVYMVEYQRTLVSLKRIKNKLTEYEETYVERAHEKFCKEFTIWMITDKKYEVESPFKVIQTSNVTEFLNVTGI